MTKQLTFSLSSRAIVNRARRRALALAPLVLGLGACIDSSPSDPGDDPLPSDISQVRTSFRISTSGVADDYGIFLVLDGDPETTSPGTLAGYMTVVGSEVSAHVPVIASVDADDTVRLPAGTQISVGVATLDWDELSLTMRDEDGDGVYESGSGYNEGQLEALPGALLEFAHDFEAGPRAFETTGRVVRVEGYGDGLLPWEPLRIELRQPMEPSERASFRLLVNGEELAGSFASDLAPTAELVFRPHGFYPLGGAITVDTGAARNLLGGAIEIDTDGLSVIPDQGPITDNPGFEDELSGWHGVGQVSAVADFHDQPPPEGSLQAVIEANPEIDSAYEHGLIGYLDVPADATALSLLLGFFSEADQLPQVVSVRMYRDTGDDLENVELYSFDHTTQLDPCNCSGEGIDPLTRRLDPVAVQGDLTALTGQRVFVEIYLSARIHYSSASQARGIAPIPPPPPPVHAALVVDDVRVE
ncbi:hypothetical protein [Haliangium sp.]|uniref:hypothetical protein n=1 Tax=Haliangium sp. TaxID=2663208 RepID=UPI003D0CD5AA